MQETVENIKKQIASYSNQIDKIKNYNELEENNKKLREENKNHEHIKNTLRNEIEHAKKKIHEL